MCTDILIIVTHPCHPPVSLRWIYHLMLRFTPKHQVHPYITASWAVEVARDSPLTVSRQPGILQRQPQPRESAGSLPARLGGLGSCSVSWVLSRFIFLWQTHVPSSRGLIFIYAPDANLLIYNKMLLKCSGCLSWQNSISPSRQATWEVNYHQNAGLVFCKN